jgi:hypothetical protein
VDVVWGCAISSQSILTIGAILVQDKAGQSFIHYYGIRMSLGLNFALLIIIYMAHHVVGYGALVLLKKSKGIRK